MSANPSPRLVDRSLVSPLLELLSDLPESLWTEGRVDSRLWDEALLDPARDILSRSGKGFRGRLLEHSWALANGDRHSVPALLPVAIELLHVGSLVIDDIEDDSSTRRGEPALHRRYGLPLALNTGNWLYFLALGVLSRLPLPPDRRLALHEDVSLGLLRCHQGQALDISVPITSVPRVEVYDLVSTATSLKSGALTGLASVLGARAAGASARTVGLMGAFGTEVGVGLQMLDDWSSIHVDARHHKSLEDLRHARPTWPWAWLAECTDQVTYAETVRQARDASIHWEFDQVRERIQALLANAAPRLIQAQLDNAISRLREGLGHGLDDIEAELEALARAYG